MTKVYTVVLVCTELEHSGDSSGIQTLNFFTVAKVFKKCEISEYVYIRNICARFDTYKAWRPHPISIGEYAIIITVISIVTLHQTYFWLCLINLRSSVTAQPQHMV